MLLLMHSPYMYYAHTIHMSHLVRSGTLLDPPNTYTCPSLTRLRCTVLVLIADSSIYQSTTRTWSSTLQDRLGRRSQPKSMRRVCLAIMAPEACLECFCPRNVRNPSFNAQIDHYLYPCLECRNSAGWPCARGVAWLLDLTIMRVCLAIMSQSGS